MTTYQIEWGGKTLKIETGKLAGLANGSATVQYGETVVLATVVMGKEPKKGMSYFPLTVDYKETWYAAGKISGSRWVKREGRPTDEAVLTGRIVDRSIRPLFDDTMRVDIQVVTSVLSFDGEVDGDIPAVIGAACALMISDIPFAGPLAAVTVGLKDGEWILNPTLEERKQNDLNILVSGRNGRVVMIEADGKEAGEDHVIKGVEWAVEQMQPVLDLLQQIQKENGKEKRTIKAPELDAEAVAKQAEVKQKVDAVAQARLSELFGIKSKQERLAKETEVKAAVTATVAAEDVEAALEEFEKLYEAEFRSQILDKKVRVDGRATDEVRPLRVEIDLMPRTHGSALFERGETQVLSLVTLGAPGDEQWIDQMELEGKKRFMHHYNFPGFSVGEITTRMGTSRRDIGHGMLAEKALEPVVPEKDKFPYTIRVVSEVLCSNGSSSQASACASSMAMMAAGVPINGLVAGIAMGLVSADDGARYQVLTDIQGVEDHSGEMDFKVAGTRRGVTAIQLDIKSGGISLAVVRDAVRGAQTARATILDAMEMVIKEPRAEMSEHAPRIETLKIDQDKIRDLIGPGGKMINAIIDEFEVGIDIEDDGTVFVTSDKAENMAKAVEKIKGVTRVIQEGEIIEGPITQIMTDRNTGSEIGAIVSLGGAQDGMIHISAVTNGRIRKVSDILKVGDVVTVKVMEVDKERGRVGLSRKALLDPSVPDPLVKPGMLMNPEEGFGGGGGFRGSRGGGGGFRGSRPGGQGGQGGRFNDRNRPSASDEAPQAPTGPISI
ncbi:MAG: polyribonucleotide nucleotidyltransferase [Patescibacteria group bacterium]